MYAAGLKPYRLRIDMGRSENGLHFASLHNGCLRVWILKELCGGEVEWILKHENDLKPMLVVHPSVFDRPVHGQGPWILEDINYNLFRSPRLPEDDREITVQENSEWYYNNGNPLDNGHEARKYSYWDTDILGFHPYKEIIFFSESYRTGLAYHLDSSKMEVLGNICPEKYEIGGADAFLSCFAYTPCLIEEFPDSR